MEPLTADRQLSLPPAQRSYWRTARIPLALALAAIAIWFAVRKVEWTVVGDTIVQSDLGLLGLAGATVLGTTLSKALRWAVLLRPWGSRPTRMQTLRVLLVGQLANSLLPARLGEPIRAVLIGRHSDRGMAAALATIAGEKVLDGLAGLLVILAVALWFPVPSWLRHATLMLAATTLFLLAFLVLMAARFPSMPGLARRSERWLGAQSHERLARVLGDFREGLTLLRDPTTAFCALGWSVVVWCLGGLTNYWTIAALGVQTTLWSVPLVLVACYVANFLPAAPAQVGVFEGACILALSAVGLGQEQALSFGLVLHVLVYAPPLLLGPVAMAYEGLSWNRLWRARGERKEQRSASE